MNIVYLHVGICCYFIIVNNYNYMPTTIDKTGVNMANVGLH